MLNNDASFKYEMAYKWTSEITQCWNNGTVTLTRDVPKNRYNAPHIKPYIYDTTVEDIISENDV